MGETHPAEEPVAYSPTDPTTWTRAQLERAAGVTP